MPAAVAVPVPIVAPALSRQGSKKEPVTPVLAKKASKKDTFDTLFILMLDKSGSMWGQRSKDLQNAVRQFLTTIENDADQQINSRVTIITYNH